MGWIATQRSNCAVNLRLVRQYRWAGLAGVAFLGLSVMSSVYGALRAIAIGIVVSRVAAIPEVGASASQLLGPLGFFAGVLLFEQVTSAVSEPLGRLAGRRVEGRLRRQVRGWLAHHADIVAVEEPATQNDLAVATAGAAGVSMSAAMASVGAALSSVLAIVASGLVLARLSAGLAAVYAVFLFAGRARLRSMSMRTTAVQRLQAPHFRRRAYLHDLNREAAKESRVFGLRQFVLDRHESSFHGPFGVLLRAYWDRQRDQYLLLAVAVACLGVIGWSAVDAALAQSISIGAATTYLLAAQSMVGAIGATTSPSAQSAELFAALDRLRGNLAVVADATAAPATDGPTRNAPLVELRGVSFRYPHSSIDVLTSVDLVLRAGESVAIVGVNGAGKTSLIKLVAGLYEPTSGTILVDGKPLTASRVPSWRHAMGAVFQDFVHYPLSVRANVALGAGESPGDAAAVADSLDRAGAGGFVSALPSAADTVLSKEFAGGTELSGGQWQRVALARAIYASLRGARLVLLDEPTANLDVRAEFDAFDRLLDATADIATVIVSHRFSTVRKADRIVVLDGGRIVQDGSHDELVAAPGLYHDMFTTQAARFVDGADEGEGIEVDA